MWLVLRYQPTTLFSLRYSTATSTGAKSLLVPSPYTIKMALLVAAIRWRGVTFARSAFPALRDLHPVRVSPAKHAVVNRCFLKYQKPREDKVSKEKRSEDYEAPIGYQSTVGFREYVYLHGTLDIALPIPSEGQGRDLLALAIRVNYFGKRGGFAQFIGHEFLETLPTGFSSLLAEPEVGAVAGILQPLDDMAPTLTFDHVDVSSDTRMNAADRPFAPALLPYRATRSASGYAAYTRTD